MRGPKVAASALALAASAVSAVVSSAVPAHAAVSTLVVHADQPFRPVTHVATGSLYGLATATAPADNLVEPLHPNTFVQMPAGGHQQGSGDILKVAPEAAKAGAKLVDRLSDYYAGWPYQFSWSSWPGAVSSQIQQVKAAGVTNLASWELWNEPDNTWLSANGTFESFWTKTYQQVRSLDPATPIQGPSFSDNISDMQNFLRNAVATNTVPDIIAWHELESSSKIAGDVATVTSLENSLGISPRPIAIEEYAAPAQVGVPGALVGYIAQFERLGVDNAELAFWNQSGALGDLLTGQGGSPNGAYWLYDWYGGMTGNMVATTPPGGGLDGAASVNPSQNSVEAVFGGGSGSTAVTVNGLNALSGFSGSSQMTVTLQSTPSPGRTVAVSGPSTLSQSTYTVSNGSITVPVSSMNSTYGYHLTVTPVTPGGFPSGYHRLVIAKNSLCLDVYGATGTAGAAIDQWTCNGQSNQQFQFVPVSGGYGELQAQNSGQDVTVANSSIAQGTPDIVQQPVNGSAASLWLPQQQSDGSWQFKNQNSGLCLDVYGASSNTGQQLDQWPCKNAPGTNQDFTPR